MIGDCAEALAAASLGVLLLALVVGGCVVARRLEALEATVVAAAAAHTSKPADVRNTVYSRTTAEATAGVTPVDLSFPPGDCRRFGYDPSGLRDSTAAINEALRVPGEAFLCEGVAAVSAPILLRANSSLVGVGSGPYNQQDPVRGSQLRPSPAFHGASVVVLDPATEGASHYINGVGLRNFCVDMTAVAQRRLIGIQVLSAADPGLFVDLKVMNQDTGQFVYVGQSANKGALQSEGIVFDNLLCLSLGIDPPNADPGVSTQAILPLLVISRSFLRYCL